MVVALRHRRRRATAFTDEAGSGSTGRHGPQAPLQVRTATPELHGCGRIGIAAGGTREPKPWVGSRELASRRVEPDSDDPPRRPHELAEIAEVRG